MTIVFMSAPLYNLIVVSERVRFGKAPVQVDRYFENIIRGNSTRCYAFQSTALVTGILLVALGDEPFISLFTNWILLAKGLLLLTLMGLLSIIHFSVQPGIDELLSQVSGDSIPPDIAKQILPLRALRRRLAAGCLFLVITIILLGVQLAAAFPPILTAILIALAALFAWRSYKAGVPKGWV